MLSVYKGHTVGSIHITALAANDDEEIPENVERFSGSVVIPFKNENIYCLHEPADGSPSKVLIASCFINEPKKSHKLICLSQIIASVPDLIAVLDQNGAALGTPEYRYGLKVLVLGVTAAPQWTDTPRGLELGDTRAFG